MTNLRKGVEQFVQFHREVIGSLADRLLHLSIEIDESNEIGTPSITVTHADESKLQWYSETRVKEKYHHSLTDKSGVTHDLIIEVNNQLCYEDYYSVISRVIQVHDAGVNAGKNDYLDLTSSTLERVVTPESLVIIASIDDEPIAYALLNKILDNAEGAREILIEVVPDKRNTGVATALFFATLEHPGTLPDHIEAEIQSMNRAVLNLLKRAQEQGYIRYTLKVKGPSTQAHIEIVHPEETI